MNRYFPRLIDNVLSSWKGDAKHKPLLLRGARQVGKSSSVKHLASQFTYYVEVNFERQPQIKELFKGELDVKRITSTLSSLYGFVICHTFFVRKFR